MEQIQNFCQRMQENRLPRYDELPALELYKDQVVEVVNRYLAAFYLTENPVTDTMVNNYVKLKVIAPPVKKRYRREQMAQLILVCLLKKVLSIAEIRQLLDCQAREGGLQSAYNYFCEELERTVQAVSGKAPVPDPEQAETKPRVKLMNHAIYSFVHKLYFELELAAQRERGELAPVKK